MEKLGFRLTLGGICLIIGYSTLVILPTALKTPDILWGLFGWALLFLLPSILCWISLWLTKQHPLIGGAFLILLGFGCLIFIGIPILANATNYTSELLPGTILNGIIFFGGPTLIMGGGWLIFDASWKSEPTYFED